MAQISAITYAKAELVAGHFPVITIYELGGSHYLSDKDLAPFSDRGLPDIHAARNARSKVLDKARKAVFG